MAKKLEEIKEEECPYELPEGWKWERLKRISKKISDGSHNPPKNSGYGVPLLSATNIHDRIINMDNVSRWITEEEWCIENKRTDIEKGDILLTIVATIGRVAMVNNEHFALQRSVAVIKPIINSLYLSYYLESPYIQQFMISNSKGTAQKGFYLKSLENLLCCVPPKETQQKIVDIIESLFAKLDIAQEKVEQVLAESENRRSAILHNAFNGKLTEKWREENNVSFDSWKNMKLGDVAKTQYGYTESATIEEVGPKFLRITDIQDGAVDWKKVPYCKISDDEFQKYKLNIGDIVVARTGATTGKSYIISDEVNSVYASYLIGVKVYDNKVSSQYIYKYMQSPLYWEQITSFSAGIAQPGVNGNKLKQLSVNIPTLPEQKEIVRLLDKLLFVEDKVKSTCQNTLEAIATMRKSILAKAFRGELCS